MAAERLKALALAAVEWRHPSFFFLAECYGKPCRRPRQTLVRVRIVPASAAAGPQPSTPASLSRAMSSHERPISSATSSVFCPSSGAGE